MMMRRKMLDVDFHDPVDSTSFTVQQVDIKEFFILKMFNKNRFSFTTLSCIRIWKGHILVIKWHLDQWDSVSALWLH